MSTNNSVSGNAEATTTPQNIVHNDSVENVASEESSPTRTLCIFSWNVKMAGLQKPRNKLGIGNHLLPHFLTEATKITIDLDQPTMTALDPTRSASLLNEDGETVFLRDDESLLLRVWKRGETIERVIMQRDKKGWLEIGVYRLDEVTVEKAKDQTIKVQFGSGQDLVARPVKFTDQEDAQRFRTLLQKMSALEQARAQRQLAKYCRCESELDMEDSDRIQLLVEVVRVKGIPKNVKPYVSIRMSGKVLHRTECATSILGSAIYTLNEHCFYLLDMTLAELFGSTGGLTFSVMDIDSIALKGGLVGRTTVPLDRILNATGTLDRILNATGKCESYSLYSASQTSGSQQTGKEDSRPILYIRMRRATPDDIEVGS